MTMFGISFAAFIIKSANNLGMQLLTLSSKRTNVGVKTYT